MSDQFFADFVARFEDAWARRDAEAFRSFWHADGLLHYPPLGAPLVGSRIGELNELTKVTMPDVTWNAIGWAARDDRLFLQMRSTATINGQALEWTAVDAFTFKDGLIIEEIVYVDMLPFWAAVDPSMKRGPMLQLGVASS